MENCNKLIYIIVSKKTTNDKIIANNNQKCKQISRVKQISVIFKKVSILLQKVVTANHRTGWNPCIHFYNNPPPGTPITCKGLTTHLDELWTGRCCQLCPVLVEGCDDVAVLPVLLAGQEDQAVVVVGHRCVLNLEDRMIGTVNHEKPVPVLWIQLH